MLEFSNLPWTRIYDYLYEVSSESNLDAFSRRALTKITSLVPDAGSYLSFYLKAPGAPLMGESIGITAKDIETYNGYYWAINPTRYGDFAKVVQIRWHDYRDTEFVTDYLRAIDVGYSMALSIPPWTAPVCISICRPRRSSPFPDRVKTILEFIQPHLANYNSIFIKMDRLSKEQIFLKEAVGDCKLLTKREAEVAVLLCRQLTTAEIASKLLLSPRTIGAHIENIKRKLEVRNKRELIAKLIGQTDP